jgi:hypothetical protein
VSQNVIPTINHFGGALPFAFTDIDQVLNYLIKKEQQQTLQTTRKQVGYKK